MSLTQVAEIKSRLEQYINRERSIQNSLSQPRQQIVAANPPDPFNSLLPDLAGVVTRELTGIPYSGKYARKFARTLLKPNQTRSLQVTKLQQESFAILQHETLVGEIRRFLETISIKKPILKQSNSHLLIQKIQSAQGFSKIETRIRRTIVALEWIATQPLVYNNSIESILTEEAKEKELSNMLSRLPRLTILRREIPEVEPPFRDFIRKHMKEQLENSWVSKIQEKFRTQFPKWNNRVSYREGRDILEGLQFGELVNILNAFPFLKDKMRDQQAMNLAISIILNERATLIHPSTNFQRDIDETKFTKVHLAINTLKDGFLC